MKTEKTVYDLLNENDVRKDYSNASINTLEYEFDNLKHWTESLAYWKEETINHYYKQFEFIEEDKEDEYQTELEHLLSRFKNASEMIRECEANIQNMMQYAKEGLYND